LTRVVAGCRADPGPQSPPGRCVAAGGPAHRERVVAIWYSSSVSADRSRAGGVQSLLSAIDASGPTQLIGFGWVSRAGCCRIAGGRPRESRCWTAAPSAARGPRHAGRFTVRRLVRRGRRRHARILPRSPGTGRHLRGRRGAHHKRDDVRSWHAPGVVAARPWNNPAGSGPGAVGLGFADQRPRPPGGPRDRHVLPGHWF